MENELTTEMENRIVDAATRTFIRKGKAGTSMQDIAGEAGINRTLLNYYFRSKDKLFDLIFQKVFIDFLPDLASEINAKVSLEEKIIRVIDRYYDILKESPYTAVFVLHEVSTNPQRLVNTIQNHGIRPTLLVEEFRQAMEKGKIKKADPRQLVINLLALIIFPFAARSVIEGMLFSNDKAAFRVFLEERREYIKKYFIESVKV
jgi:TetR/AcrR family transcriptional regulator